MMEIYMIRHGETMWNQQHRLQGRKDIPLNDVGLAGARIAAEALKDVHFDRVFSSPLVRAKKTAEIILKNHPDLSIEPLDDLQEIAFGTGEGIEMRDDVPHTEAEKEILDHLKRWFAYPDTVAPLPGGESIREVKDRIEHFLDTCIYPNEDTYERVMVTCHGGILRGIESIVRNLSDADYWDGGIVPNCGAMVLELKDGRLSIEKVVDLINQTETVVGLGAHRPRH